MMAPNAGKRRTASAAADYDDRRTQCEIAINSCSEAGLSVYRHVLFRSVISSNYRSICMYKDTSPAIIDALDVNLRQVQLWISYSNFHKVI